MPGPIESFLFSILDLARGSISVFLPVFIATLIGRLILKKTEKRMKWKWLSNAFAATFALLWIVILALYFYPVLTSLQETNVGETPSVFAPSATTLAASYVYGLFRVTVSALVISLLLLPLEFIGLFIFESLLRRFPELPEIANIALACYLTSAISAAIILFIIPEAPTGIFYFIFYG